MAYIYCIYFSWHVHDLALLRQKQIDCHEFKVDYGVKLKSLKTKLVAGACNLALRRWRQENHKFKVIFDSRASWRPASLGYIETPSLN